MTHKAIDQSLKNIHTELSTIILAEHDRTKSAYVEAQNNLHIFNKITSLDCASYSVSIHLPGPPRISSTIDVENKSLKDAVSLAEQKFYEQNNKFVSIDNAIYHAFIKLGPNETNLVEIPSRILREHMQAYLPKK
ncbi:MAG: hypothetical protein WC758_00315 [Candidatus Woesearchaeota archaeon]|jgi:hypothetical protein